MTLTGGKLCGERGYTRGLERAPHYLEKGGNKSFGFDQILLVVQKLVEKKTTAGVQQNVEEVQLQQQTTATTIWDRE